MKTQRRITQYLDRYTLPESRAAASLVVEHSLQLFERALCIPMFDESMDLIHALQYHPGIRDTLVILVVNAPDSATSPALDRTRELLRTILNLNTNHAGIEHAGFLSFPARETSFSLLVMDHCSPGRQLPQKEGVGLARKLGNDVALELWHRNLIKSPWLHQTDADATLPDNYFATPEMMSRCAAIHLDFEHVRPTGISLAQTLYDLKLDYYVAGLNFAQSPFAHYSVGSSLVIHADYYAIVRGYPKISAGEDFHILNKLAKEGYVAFDSSRKITLAERDSSRVPFGTGPGVARFESCEAPLTTPCFYAPECFVALKQWLSFLQYCSEFFAGNASFDAAQYFSDFVDNNIAVAETRDALKQLDLFSWLERTLRKNRNVEQSRRQLKTGMDALKTLRLIHALRDRGLKNVDAGTAAQWLLSNPGKQVRSRSDVYRSLVRV